MIKNVLQKSVICLLLCVFIHSYAVAAAITKSVSIVTAKSHHSRIDFGVKKITEALKRAGYTVKPGSAVTITVGLSANPVSSNITVGQTSFAKKPAKESYTIVSRGKNIVISGSDNSGALYGCLELAERIDAAKGLPATINFADKPEMVLRGACIGMQKPALLPNRGVYEYPYTPENFPWFYDKALWVRYLDMMVENRMNSLYLWNGHPFASLVKLKEYPYAVEVDDATFKKNEEIFKFLTEEADKRGIWVIQMFYNIIIPRPFADKHKLKTQDRNRPIIPLISDYTRKSIAAFVEKYPNVGLMVALGEAMEGVGQDDVDWFTKTIIPGVKDGLKALGKTEEPPIVLRAHDTDAPMVMKAALPLYKNLYTEAKFNGEALTTYEPRGPWAELHRTLSRIGTVQIENVHILANLEPFRYGSPDFVQKSVLAMHNTYEANGLHLYPQASYWDWPYTADNANGKRILQIDRDWIWYKEWARYAWNCHRDRRSEIAFWTGLLAQKYGTTQADAKYILDAYEESGEISPQILRRVGITDGNRQTMTLGMLMQQFVNPEKFGLFSLLYNSEAPVGEILSEYAEREWKHQPHVGETPLIVANNIVAYGKRAVEAIERVKGVKKDDAEFARLKNDMYCYNAMANSYSHKIKAAISVLRYKYSEDVADLDKALPEMETSLKYFEELVNLTKDSYLYANSMQTRQRKIPVPGTDAKMKTWVELLPVYQAELANFKKNIEKLKSTKGVTKTERAKLTNAEVTLAGGVAKYSLANGQAYTDSTGNKVVAVAPELAALNGLQLSRSAQVKDGTAVTFTNSKPVKVLVGYFVNKDNMYLQPPQLETDASANDYGQADIKITGAIQVAGLPPVNVHTYTFKAGTNTLTLGKGAALVLGFINDDVKMPVYDAGLSNEGNIKDLRWLFN